MKSEHLNKSFILVEIIILAAVLSACTTNRPGPELALIYNKSAQYYKPDRNPIIAIPGILGSKLKDLPSRKIVWGAFEPKAADPADPVLWERNGWGLADPDQDKFLEMLMPDITDAPARRDAALDLQRRILRRTRAFQRALDRPAATPDDLQLILVVGDAAETNMRASINSAHGTLQVVAKGPGDGTVLRSSALLDERVGQEWRPWLETPIDFHAVMFLPGDHVGLTQSAIFQDNILFWLLEAPR